MNALAEVVSGLLAGVGLPWTIIVLMMMGAIYALATDLLVPRKRFQDMERDRDFWRDVGLASAEMGNMLGKAKVGRRADDAN